MASPRNHKPLMSPERGPAAGAVAADALATELEATPEVLVMPRVEPVVLPYYRSPRELRAERLANRAEAVDEAIDEAFSPGRGALLPELEPIRDAAEGSFGEMTLLEVVIGNDDRVKVAEALTKTNPWRQICSLRIMAASGTVYVGTAWFIGPRILATAGHCVYMQNQGGWAASIDVIPGRFGASEPYGRATATQFAAVDGWINTGTRDFDYGVIFLADGTLGTKVGNFAVQALPDGELVGVTSRISGYPMDLERAAFQYYHERPIQKVSPTRLEYDIDTFGGQSGSPIWHQVDGKPPVAIGVHTTGGASSNSGTRISDAVLDNLIRWSEES